MQVFIKGTVRKKYTYYGGVGYGAGKRKRYPEYYKLPLKGWVECTLVNKTPKGANVKLSDGHIIHKRNIDLKEK